MLAAATAAGRSDRGERDGDLRDQVRLDLERVRLLDVPSLHHLDGVDAGGETEDLQDLAATVVKDLS